MLEKWYGSEADATEQALRAWGEDAGIQLDDPATSTDAG